MSLAPVLKVVRTHWRPSPEIIEAASTAVSKLFGIQKFIAVHWRFEETKCRGVGTLLPEDRQRKADYNREELSAEKNMEIVGNGPLCLYSVRSVGDSKLVKLITVTTEEAGNLLNQVKESANITNVFFSTDVNPDLGRSFLQELRETTNVKMMRDLPRDWSTAYAFFLNHSDVTSRLEQEICTRSTIFIGTSSSSWTQTVKRQRELAHSVKNDTMLDHLIEDYTLRQ
mmetsp:Transcript_33978/g.74348  ORF Transcript_33978/g.74348 Transcript_33978/m.74348 type:complete len:227 (-) Transcript_33978:451-1131(-)